jgi:hypothetical protein
MKTKLFSKLAIGSIATMGFVTTAGLANAANITGSITYDTPNPIGLTTANWDTLTPPPNPMEVKGFLPGEDGIPLGAMLTGVKVTLMADGQFDYAVENISPTSATTGSVDLLVDVSITGGGLTPVDLTVTPDNSYAVDLTTFDGNIDFGGTSGVTFPTASDSDMDMAVVPAAFWNLYDGVASVLFNAAADSDKDADLSGGSILEQTTWLAGAKVSVQYDYEVQMPMGTPEPGSMLGLGLIGGLGLLAKRKKS